MLAYDNGKSAVRVLPGRVVPQSVHRWRTLKPGERGGESTLDPPRQASGGDVTDAVLPPVQLQQGEQEEARDSTSSKGQQNVSAACCGSAGNDSETLGGGSTNLVRKKDVSDQADQADQADQSDHLVNRVAMADPRELRFDEVLECSDPCVLHYPSCGLNWLRDKYHLLGSFPSSWFDGKLPIAPCFHLDARDAIHTHTHRGKEALASPDNGGSVSEGSEGDVEVGGDAEEGGDGGRTLYRKEVMLCPDEHSEEMQAQLEHGVLREIDGPASVIRQALDARGPPGSKIAPGMLPSKAGGARLDSQEEGSRASDDGLDRSPRGSSSTTVTAALHLAGAILPGTAAPPTRPVAEGGGQAGNGDARPAQGPGGGVDNSWILAACARNFL